MKKRYEEVTDEKYLRFGGALVLPYVDLIKGIPKHETNNIGFYNSVKWTLRKSYFISNVFTLVILSIVFGLLNITLSNAITTYIISVITMLLVSQINNMRRITYFNDEKYSKVCKTYFLTILVQTITYVALSTILYFLYIN